MVKSNDVFGRLKVLHNVGGSNWLCQCLCGQYAVVKSFHLRNGNNKSCGCLKRSVLGDSKRTHGKANSRLTGYANKAYGVWQAMRDRCSNANRKDYHRYGGRGIKVCKRWEKFEMFYADMGDPQPGQTLDRINNDSDYKPSNCRWATRKEQSHNSTRIRYITIGTKTRMLREWLEVFKISRDTFYRRKRKGLTDEQALKGDAK
jgi:hypothetical protein